MRLPLIKEVYTIVQGVQKLTLPFKTLITLEPTFALKLQPYILIEETCRIILVPNTMLLDILKFNYNVNYVKRKKHTSKLRGRIDVRRTLLQRDPIKMHQFCLGLYFRNQFVKMKKLFHNNNK